jgi:hypothetical protein
MDYEDHLVNALELAKEEIAYRSLVRGLNRTLRSVFTWLRHYPSLPDAHIIEAVLTKAVSEMSKQLATFAPRAQRQFTFRGRPGEPWLLPIVAQLSDIFRGHGMRANAANRAIVEVLALAGHGNVVNLTLVKRLIRKR